MASGVARYARSVMSLASGGGFLSIGHRGVIFATASFLFPCLRAGLMDRRKQIFSQASHWGPLKFSFVGWRYFFFWIGWRNIFSFGEFGGVDGSQALVSCRPLKVVVVFLTTLKILVTMMVLVRAAVACGPLESGLPVVARRIDRGAGLDKLHRDL